MKIHPQSENPNGIDRIGLTNTIAGANTEVQYTLRHDDRISVAYFMIERDAFKACAWFLLLALVAIIL